MCSGALQFFFLGVMRDSSKSMQHGAVQPGGATAATRGSSKAGTLGCWMQLSSEATDQSIKSILSATRCEGEMRCCSLSLTRSLDSCRDSMGLGAVILSSSVHCTYSTPINFDTIDAGMYMYECVEAS